MRLYSGPSTDFVGDKLHNWIVVTLNGVFFRKYRSDSAPTNVNSWRNSLRSVSLVLRGAKLQDHGIMLESLLPMSSKRLEGMITGREEAGLDSEDILEVTH